MKLACLISSLATLFIAVPAHSDELTTPIAQSGDWVAMEHRMSMTSASDMCLAANVVSHIAFRSENESVQLRVINDDWTLPTKVVGQIVITIGAYKRVLDIDDNSSTMVNAELSEQDYTTLFAAMDNSSTMNIAVGKAAPFTVSLVGSSKITNAFKTCSGIRSTGPKGGNNPFQ
jgi:hypothetical protein